MSGPIGSAYPGNLFTSVFGCFLFFLSVRASLSAYRQRHDNTKPQESASAAGFAVLTFLAALFAFYTVWVHR